MPGRRVQVDVLYNGKHLKTATAAFSRPELLKKQIGDGDHGFFVALPPLVTAEDAEIAVFESTSRVPIGKPIRLQRTPSFSPNQIRTADALDLLKTPLFSIEGFAITGANPTLNVSGMHLPPGGDPFSLRITSDPGVVFTTKYPYSRPPVREWYWFWPNAVWSGFQVSVDLVASTATGPDFQFSFDYPDAPPERAALKLNRFWIPKDLSVFQNFPTGDKLTRVHTFDTTARVAISGYTDFRKLQGLAEHYGKDLRDGAILDWGCGHGRAIRFFEQHQAVREAWGVDIDKENVGWLRDHLPNIKAQVVPLMPPTKLPAKHFDMIYAISVMTHLRREVQDAWLKELKRISKPGALIMLTFAGRGSAAFASRYLSSDWLERWKRSGFDDTLQSKDLVGKIEDPSYYTNTKQTPEDVREHWGKHFEILGIHECAFGYQDLAVMRVPTSSSRSRPSLKSAAKKAPTAARGAAKPRRAAAKAAKRR